MLSEKLQNLSLLDLVKVSIIAVRSVQDDAIFLKWSKEWLEDVDRTITTASQLEYWTSPGGKCARATIELRKWQKETVENYKKIYEKLCRQFCEDTVQATFDNWCLSLDLEEFIPELKNYPETGSKSHLKKYPLLYMSPTEREKNLEKCNYTCEICKVHHDFAPSGVTYGLVMDHDHSNGKFRSMICSNCNRMLGFAKDDPEVLRNGASYLEKYARIHAQQTKNSLDTLADS